MPKWIKRIIQWNRKRKLRNAVRELRGEAEQFGINIDVVQNGEVEKNDIVLYGPDGSRIIVSGLEGTNIKEAMREREK